MPTFVDGGYLKNDRANLERYLRHGKAESWRKYWTDCQGQVMISPAIQRVTQCGKPSRRNRWLAWRLSTGLEWFGEVGSKWPFFLWLPDDNPSCHFIRLRDFR
jgi:hypothetical protein